MFARKALSKISDEEIREILVQGGSAKHLTDSQKKRLPKMIKEIADHVIKSDDDAQVPCWQTALVEIPHVDEAIARRVLQSGFGLFAGPSLNINCRKVCLATQLLDWDEFKDDDDDQPVDIPIDKISHGHLEKTLLTWFDGNREDWTTFDVVLTSLSFLLVKDNRKRKVRSVIKNRFVHKDQEELLDMVKDILVYYDLEDY